MPIAPQALAEPFALVLFLFLLVRAHTTALATAQQRTAAADSFLDHAPSATLVLDEEWRIQRLNKAAEQLLRCDVARLLGREFSSILFSADESTDSATFPVLPAPVAGSLRQDVCCRRADGDAVPVHVRTKRVKQRGRMWIVVTLRDATADNAVKRELRQYVQQLIVTKEALQRHNTDLEGLIEARTEELRVAKEAADAANSAKSTFLSNMSHELRTPLHAILSFARFGAGRFERVERSKLLTYFQRIESAGNTLLKLLDELLDLSKLEAGKVQLHCEAVALAELIEQLAGEFSALVREKQVRLDTPRLDADDVVWGDRDKLCQVLRNLVGNAIKFTPSQGSIEIAVEDAGDDLVVSVRDTGPGIPDEECDAVFDKFVRSRTVSSAVAGTGLGLAICREIVLLHQGSIRAIRTHGQGALLLVSLPRWKPRPESRGALVEPHAASQANQLTHA